MCRIISFISSKGGVGKTTLITELAKMLSDKSRSVCVFDSYFGMNSLSLKFETEGDIDFKEYLNGELGSREIINKVEANLFYIKTNSARYDYLMHYELIKFFIDEVSSWFDFILIDVNCFNSRILNLFLECSNEICLVVDDTEETIRNSAKVLQKVCFYNNIKNQKIILNKARIIGEIKGKILSEDDIEDILKREVIFTIPKFYKNNYFTKNKSTIKIRNLMNNFCLAFIENKKVDGGCKNEYKGVIGLIKRKVYEKFE